MTEAQKNIEFARSKGIELDRLYRFNYCSRPSIIVRAVDWEQCFGEPSLSYGLIHFADPDTGEKIAFCGINWFVEYSDPIEEE